MNTISKQMGERIRQLRTMRGLSQEDLADKSHLHRSHLGEIERGEVSINLEILQKVGASLKTPLADLVRGLES